MKDCKGCKNFKGLLKSDIDLVKCNYWKNIEMRAAIDSKAIVCPRMNFIKKNKTDGITWKAIKFISSLNFIKIIKLK